MSISPLPVAPDAAFDPNTYRGRVGAYRGQLHEVRWGYYRGWLHGQVRRALVRKRWFQVVVHADPFTLIVRIQDNGTFGLCHSLVLDRDSGRVLVDHVDEGAPLRTMVTGFMAGEGTEAYLRAGQTRMSLTRGEGDPAWKLAGDLPGLAVDLVVDTANAPPTTLLVGEGLPPREHRPGLTQRSLGLLATGTLEIHGDTHSVSHPADVVYANAFLPPEITLDTLSASVPGGPGVVCSDGTLHGTSHERFVVFADGAFAASLRRDGDDLQGDVQLHFSPQVTATATVRRRLPRLHHGLRWTAGMLSGTVHDAEGRAIEVQLPALAEHHRLRG